MAGPSGREGTTETVAEVFRRVAEDFERGGSPLYARLARSYANDPLLVRIAGDHRPRWEVPLKVFGGVHYLALSGREPEPWERFGQVLSERREWLASFVRDQPVQTNEVQRSWALLPAFLTVARPRPLALVELGPSAGFNLYWDRYRYRYGDARWGPADAPLELEGVARNGPPDTLFEREVAVTSRVGIDRAPVDLRDKDAALLLQAFVWADQEDRVERLRRAIELIRGEPPEIERGDYLELLAEVLARRDLDLLTIVYHSASTSYLRSEERERLRATIEEDGARGSLAWISYEFIERDGRPQVGFESFALDVMTFPSRERRRLALGDGHGNRITWRGEEA
ncbi:MAG: DUF2332 domain-containing protein [Actinobacteria bacterium]|nr:DUF2332 domain-containing protein [Actinomycetota bacterium]